MKYDFSIPSRQSKVAILLLIIKYYKIIIRQAWPFLLISLFGGKKDQNFQYILYFIIAISIISLVMAVLSYYRFYFHVKGDELFIEKGVFKKSKLNIPFERIQTVNFEQSIILQAFDNVKLEVDTAGSSQKEFTFEAIEKDKAEQLRETILAGKRDIDEASSLSNMDTDIANSETFPIVGKKKEEQIFKLGPIDLFKIGLTENHLKAGLWVLGIFAYAYSNLEDAGFDVEEQIENYGVLDLGISTSIIVVLALMLLVALIVISVIRTFIKNFDLTMNRLPNGFKIYSGLFNRKEFTAPDHKIQRISWGDNPIKRIFGIFNLWLHQARSSDAGRKKSIGIPIVDFGRIEAILGHLYTPTELADLEEYKISKRWYFRGLVLFIWPIAIIISLFAIYFGYLYLMVSTMLIAVYMTISNWVQYKKTKYLFNAFILQRKKGVYGNFNEIIPWYKTQSVELVQSIYQRRHELATIKVTTAAGAIVIPYIPLKDAMRLRDFALYKAEKSRKKWM